MPITRKDKEQVVADLEEKLGNSKTAIFTTFKGLKITDAQALRSELKQANIDYLVTKKTLLGLALKNKGYDFDTKSIEGEVASVFGYHDEVEPAKIVSDFAKDHEQVQMLGGIFNGELADAAQMSALAKLPSKEELYAKMVGSMSAPVRNFVGVMQANLRNIVGVLNAIKEQKS